MKEEWKVKISSLGEKYQVLLHINANEANIDHKVNQSACCSLENNKFLATEVAQRLACDANIRTVLEDDDGNVLNIGRRSRVIPRAMAHAVRIRDGGCRFPGCCCHIRYTDAHHIEHWAQGGETSLDNLLSLCRFHHTLLHKGEYQIDHDQTGDMIFTNKHNEVITQSVYPQFPKEIARSAAGEHVDPAIDERTAECKWLGETMDIQMGLSELFRLDGQP